MHTGTAVAVFCSDAVSTTRAPAPLPASRSRRPGVSLSAGIISTDVPLLFCWAVALLALAHMLERRARWPALLLGLAFGLGLNAKYAMAWFIVCLGVYLRAALACRALLKDARLYLALAIGLLLLAPNLLWNASHGFATLAHRRQRKMDRTARQPAARAGIPWRAVRRVRPHPVRGTDRHSGAGVAHGVPEPDRLLLAFALPVLVVITLQALLSRAHANWAAVSYVAGTVLVTATLVRDLSWRWLAASFAINGTAAVLIVGDEPRRPRRAPVRRTPSRARSAGANSPRPCAANSSRRGNRAARSAPS